MCRGTRDGGRGKRGLPLLTLAACLLPLALFSGCRTVVDTVAGVFSPGEVGETIDAHVVYRLRPDCPTLVARTTRNGYTVLTPTSILDDDVQQVPEFVGAEIEESGLFEGPVRTGEVVFRYIPPAESETWSAGGADVIADVEAIRLGLEDAHDRLVAMCGEEVEGEASDTVPRIPGQ